MESKEALEKLFNDIKQFEEHFVGCICNDTKEEYYLIKKDLEVLEIIKRHCDFSSPLSMNYFIEFFIYNSDEDFEKVKEWLEDE